MRAATFPLASMQRAVLALMVSAAALLGLAATSQAAPGCEPGVSECPPLLAEFGSLSGSSLSGEAGALYVPVVATDASTGHIFAAETGNNRVSEFDAQGGFVKAWGWGVRDGAAEPQTCTTASGCKAGLSGGGSGQIELPFGITLDAEGNVWVLEVLSLRLQKFTPAGEFLLAVGGEVNKTRVQEREGQEANSEPVTVTEAQENLCTKASGDVCGVGTAGMGDGEFSSFVPRQAGGNQVDLAPDGTIYVGDEDRIQKFAADGTYAGQIPMPGAGKTDSLTITPDGRLYVISDGITEKVSKGSELVDSKVVREVGPAGEELSRLKGSWQGRSVPKNPLAVAADADGNVYVSSKVVYDLPVKDGEKAEFEEVGEVIAFEDGGSLISFEPGRAGFDTEADADLINIATNVVGDGSGEPGEVLVVHSNTNTLGTKPLANFIRAFGRPFEVLAKPPAIKAPFATAVGSDEASVETSINPGSTADTTFQVEYGTGSCGSGGCEAVAPAEPEQLGGGAASTAIPTGPVSLQGLAPGTTYHYRFVAENEAGGPVFSAEGTLRTFAPSLPLSCPSSAFRLGASAQLPDCRAYELVSPPDKEGGELHVLNNVTGYSAGLDQGTPQGEAITYSSYRSFGEAVSAPYTSQYLARRGAGGWSSEPISPRREGTLAPNLDSQYKVFSEDLASGWFASDSEPVLAPGAIPGQRNLYRRESQSGAYEAQCPALAPEASNEQFRLEPQGSSVDGSHFFFAANDRLTPDAVGGKVPQLYECVNGSELRLVSILPGGEASPTGGSAGTDDGGILGFGFRMNNTAGAVSEDGSRVFWTADSGPGPLYARIDGERTIEIAAANSRFRAASPDGTRVIYTTGDALMEASVESESATSSQIAGELLGMMGASEDARLVYFVSREDLDEGGPATDGGRNLYLYRADSDTYTFIAALAALDAREEFISEESAPVLSPIARSPNVRSARISPDGLHAAFTSEAPLAGYDNTDQASGEALAEVFLYDAGTEELLCVSCNPSGSRPRGVNAGTPELPFWAAAKIPGWSNHLYASRALAEDGSRLYFESYDSLALADTNGVQDVYQWEEAGAGSCTSTSPTYSPSAQGCIDLISSGKSPEPSAFVDASTDGRDVFFKTSSSLFPTDPGLIDLYDAREGGGFAPPAPPAPACEGEACQPAVVAPPAPTAGSAAFRGSGNVAQKERRKRCTVKRAKRGAKGRAKARAARARCAQGKNGKAG